MAIVVFNPTTFKVRFPEFASKSDPLLSLYFDEATIYCNNTDRSPVKDIPLRTAMLNNLTAHIAALAPSDESGRGQLVGRISSASEGSVSVSAEAMPMTEANAWFMQTQYGAAFWRMSAPYRHAFFVPPCKPIPTFVPGR